MRKEEAVCIGSIIKKISLKNGGPVLNIGSSTRTFREKLKPHINDNIFAPLKNHGIQVIHSDLKADEGVDVSGDLFDSKIQIKLASFKPKVILASNLMEHLPDDVRQKLPEVLSNIIAEDGFIVISVPYSYPLHFDPIDTYYRPSPGELCELFPDCKKVETHIISSTTYFNDLIKSDYRVIIRTLVRLCLPFYRPKKWFALFHRFFWLFRSYKVSLVVLQK